MKILLTNDDGIEAPGLWAAASALRRVGDVCVVAPHEERSGVGSALTLRAPIKVSEVPADGRLQADSADGAPVGFSVKAFAVEGTPADSCILALEKLVGKVDLVVSGINAGSNVGWDIMVSGTVGAALQGYFRGYPTIAISVGGVRNPLFEGAARLLGLMAARLNENSAQEALLLNINVPNVPVDQIAGLQVTRLGGRSYGESVREEMTGPGKQYKIDRNVPIGSGAPEGTDIWALKNNHVSVTPLQVTLGHMEQTGQVESLVSGIIGQLALDD
ncbi:MAG: 5'/3'-nucleotidase SurE [SAR202 cluster bacterium Io17-Chloro-G9]|nr:MAG: 5'/3'-nucleotidase SurE [SAR202 cluster bacterium Io17-Chloro-G9]